MLLLKFSKNFFFLFFISLSFSVNAQKFNSKQCLDAKFSTSIKHDGKLFGLIKNELTLKKSDCIIEITFKNILESKWVIDICREPIHIKMTSKGSQNVYKRVANCSPSSEIEYCLYRKELTDILQDYGLIFAEGERETLETSHGQTYCAYMLIKSYLNDGHLFSKYDFPKNIFGKVDVPVIVEPSPSAEEVAPNIEPIIPSVEIEKKADILLEDSAPKF